MGRKVAKKEKNAFESIEEEVKQQMSDPWISKGTGIIVIAVVSFIFTLWVFSTGNPDKPFFERLGIALIFGATIWIAAIIFYIIHRLIMRR